MNKDELSKVKQRSKRHFSEEDKKNFYIQWKASGLCRTAFCRKYDLTPSAFGKWCRQLYPNNPTQSPQNNWIPVVSKKSSIPQKEMINVKIPHITNILLLALFFILFIQGLLDAIAIIW